MLYVFTYSPKAFYVLNCFVKFMIVNELLVGACVYIKPINCVYITNQLCI